MNPKKLFLGLVTIFSWSATIMAIGCWAAFFFAFWFRLIVACCRYGWTFALVLIIGSNVTLAGTPVLFTLKSLTGTPNNRQIFVQPDKIQNPLIFGTNLVPMVDFYLQPTGGQVLTNLAPWGYTIKVDGWPRSAHINVPDTTNTINVVSLINTNAFSPLNIYNFAPLVGTNGTILTTNTDGSIAVGPPPGTLINGTPTPVTLNSNLNVGGAFSATNIEPGGEVMNIGYGLSNDGYTNATVNIWPETSFHDLVHVDLLFDALGGVDVGTNGNIALRADGTDGGVITLTERTSATNTIILNGQTGNISAANYTITGTTNQLIFGGTNAAPLSTNLVRWISVQITGDTNLYKLGLAK
ncbi:MAG: hypothetical protein P4N60_19125 [Verrucomicrobiae bacterium]|nr:hypothetical protein [Verrucomicrobiae bacterium]